MSIERSVIPVETADGHRFELLATLPREPRSRLLWLPALGVPARHYQPLADELAARGVATFLHEWRGVGSSDMRASRDNDWGYAQILQHDLPGSQQAVDQHFPAPSTVIGGHSIGAQFAALHLALHPGSSRTLWLVASGSPYWRNFPAPMRFAFPLAFQFVPWLADRRGLLHGRKFGFAGNEARTLMRDWATIGLSNRYAAAGLDVDLELALRDVEVVADAVLLRKDWYAPKSSLQALLDKMPKSASRVTVLDADALGVRADHFAWMKQPGAVVEALLGNQAAS
jgi:predicted alpha/beta hydrolase